MIRVLDPFSPLFSKRAWEQAQLLRAGAIVARGNVPVASALRAVSLQEERRFCRYNLTWAGVAPYRRHHGAKEAMGSRQ
jgi:hypothetical protein